MLILVIDSAGTVWVWGCIRGYCKAAEAGVGKADRLRSAKTYEFSAYSSQGMTLILASKTYADLLLKKLFVGQ